MCGREGEEGRRKRGKGGEDVRKGGRERKKGREREKRTDWKQGCEKTKGREDRSVRTLGYQFWTDAKLMAESSQSVEGLIHEKPCFSYRKKLAF